MLFSASLATQKIELQTRGEKKVSFRKNRKFSRFFAKKCDFFDLEFLYVRMVVGVDTMQYNTTFYALFGLETVNLKFSIANMRSEKKFD